MLFFIGNYYTHNNLNVICKKARNFVYNSICLFVIIKMNKYNLISNICQSKKIKSRIILTQFLIFSKSLNLLRIYGIRIKVINKLLIFIT